MMSRSALAVCFYLVSGQAGLAQTPSAVIVPNAFTQFLDANGKPLVGGTVYYYVPGTTTNKVTWQDPYQNIVNANPVVLNGSGEALIWGSGIYREVVYDVNNNLIWDQLTGGYNCVGGGAVPMGANGAVQFNNNGVFGGLPLGNSSQVLFGNASGPPTWGPISVAVGNISGLGAGLATALTLAEDGSGALCGATGCTLTNPTLNGATLNSPTINTPTVNGGTWANPTFTGAITGLPGGGGAGSFSSIVLTGATPVVGSGQLGLGASFASAPLCNAISVSSGSGTTNALSCIVINISGVTHYVPVY